MKIELTPAVIACLKRGLNCWPEQNFADGAEIREILRMNFRLVKALASQAPLVTTHYEGCWGSGPKHYECALLEVKRLQEVNTKARNDMLKLFEIKNRFTGEVLFSAECESLKICVEAAVKGNTDLRNADLSNADLSNADLSNADLSNANLSNADLSNADLRKANLSGICE